MAPFVPQRANLTPAEEKAHFIMLPMNTPAADGDGGGGGGGSSSKQLTVFSENGMLLGFYEEVGSGAQAKSFEMWHVMAPQGERETGGRVRGCGREMGVLCTRGSATCARPIPSPRVRVLGAAML